MKIPNGIPAEITGQYLKGVFWMNSVKKSVKKFLEVSSTESQNRHFWDNALIKYARIPQRISAWMFVGISGRMSAGLTDSNRAIISEKILHDNPDEFLNSFLKRFLREYS